MKKITLTVLSFIITFSIVNAQKGIHYNHIYGAGGRLNMHVDSAAKIVYYDNVFPNQPQTFFNYLPDASFVSVQMYFQKTEHPENFRYTILEDNKPLIVNKLINKEQLQHVIRKDDKWKDEILDSTSLGIFSIKDKTITILTYDILRPQDVYKNVFYGKPIPRAKIKSFAKRFKTDLGVDYDYIIEPKDKTNLTFREKDDELTIIKDWSNIDYIYRISIKDKQRNEIIFESTAWEYGGTVDVIDGYDVLLPYVRFNKGVFRKSGDYEIIIQPMLRWDNCLNCAMTTAEIEKFSTTHTLAITLDQENFTLKDLLIYIFIVGSSIGLVFLFIFKLNKRQNQKNLAEQEVQKNSAKLQLQSIRSQLNPHFLFNALSGIQNLMNKNEIDHANKYLAKFARLTRNVLDSKELISLSQEKALLDDYLQMEQLRFGFQYEINHVTNLDLVNIEIPSMLLQPLVENAVKHGISQKATAGKIKIEFIKQANDLVLTVIDNGSGFDVNKQNNGLGLQLSRSRLALLNTIYKENHFILAVQSNTTGTAVNLKITDWLT